MTTTAPSPALSVVSMVNDEPMHRVSRASLDVQAEGAEWLTVHPDQTGQNAATALNSGIERAHAEWILCAHQDVLFPPGWWSRLTTQLAACPPQVAVAGLVGVRRDGSFRGHVLDPHGHRRWLPLPADVVSLDEHVLILRREAGLRFDPENPGFHCYGTDIAMNARERGLRAVALDAPVVHLSGGRIDPEYARASEWLLAKWGGRLDGVVPTPARLIESAAAPRARRLGTRLRRRRSRRGRACGCATLGRPDPAGAS